MQVHTETRGVRSPGAGVTGDCEPPEVGAGNMLLTAKLILQSQTLFTFLLFMLSDLFEYLICSNRSLDNGEYSTKLQPSKRMVLDLKIRHLSSLPYRLRLEEASVLRDGLFLSADFAVCLLVPRSLEHNVPPFLRSGSCYPWIYPLFGIRSKQMF